MKAHVTVLSFDVSASGTISAVQIANCAVKHAAAVFLRGLCEAIVADKRAAIMLPPLGDQPKLLATALAIALGLSMLRASAVEFVVNSRHDADRTVISGLDLLSGFRVSQRSSDQSGFMDAEIIISLEHAARIDHSAFGNITASAEVVVAEASAVAEDELSARFEGGVVRLASLSLAAAAEGGSDVFMAFTRPGFVRCSATPNGIVWPLEGMTVRAGEINAVVLVEETDANLSGLQPVLILSQYTESASQMVARTILGGFMLPFPGLYEQPLGAPTASARVDGSGSGWVKLEAAQYALDFLMVSSDQVEMRRLLWENTRNWRSLEGADPHPDLAALLSSSHSKVTFRVSPLPP